MLSQNAWLSVSDFIVLVSFIFLLPRFFKNQAFNRNQSHLYIKQTTAAKTMSFYFQILTLLLFNLGQVIRTPFILLGSFPIQRSLHWVIGCDAVVKAPSDDDEDDPDDADVSQ